MKVLSSLWVAVCLLCAYREARGAVISIDFGAEWIKIALVKVGIVGREGGKAYLCLSRFLYYLAARSSHGDCAQ